MRFLFVWSDARVLLITNRCDIMHMIRCGSCLYKKDQFDQTDAMHWSDARFYYASQTKVLERVTKDEVRVFEALFRWCE